MGNTTVTVTEVLEKIPEKYRCDEYFNVIEWACTAFNLLLIEKRNSPICPKCKGTCPNCKSSAIAENGVRWWCRACGEGDELGKQ